MGPHKHLITVSGVTSILASLQKSTADEKGQRLPPIEDQEGIVQFGVHRLDLHGSSCALRRRTQN